jgi:hypothetical protein
MVSWFGDRKRTTGNVISGRISGNDISQALGYRDLTKQKSRAVKLDKNGGTKSGSHTTARRWNAGWVQRKRGEDMGDMARHGGIMKLLRVAGRVRL